MEVDTSRSQGQVVNHWEQSRDDHVRYWDWTTFPEIHEQMAQAVALRVKHAEACVTLKTSSSS